MSQVCPSSRGGRRRPVAADGIRSHRGPWAVPAHNTPLARAARRRSHGRATGDGRISESSGLPEDLLALQRRWYAAEAARTADPTEENRSALTAVGAELHAHPHWAQAGNRHEALMRLQQDARPNPVQDPAA
ncbi:hypothetical protein [Kitasatospora purpeofusca]|uniref:hypothetical protein n=1 Tax=Kitasatospora purpeofusca TaxID=67352 RepID=UPI0036D3095C